MVGEGVNLLYHNLKTIQVTLQYFLVLQNENILYLLTFRNVLTETEVSPFFINTQKQGTVVNRLKIMNVYLASFFSSEML